MEKPAPVQLYWVYDIVNFEVPIGCFVCLFRLYLFELGNNALQQAMNGYIYISSIPG